jgi:hypothetical protein
VGKTTVRVSMFAEPIEVDEDEVDNLRHQGLLIEDQPEPDPAGTKPPAKKPTKAPEPTKET